MSSDSGLYGAYLALGLQALIPIALGSFKSLKTPESTLRRRKAAQKHNPDRLLLGEGDEDDEDESLEETLTWADSLLFPVFGSVALLGLWAILKYVGKKWINLILGIYFSGAGVFAVQSTFSSIVAFVIRQTSYKPTTYHIRISSGIRQIFHLPMNLSSLLVLPFSLALPALYLPLGRPYILSNILALSLSTATLALLKLDSFLTAFSLLGVLLIYDIFWVFATPVMVTVAKGIDAPIKILSPKSSPFGSHTPKDFAMLGLGDIVVPGLVIALCLRYDLSRYARQNPTKDVSTRSKFGKSYFYAGLVSYVLGLGTTMAVMHYTQHAQPALLYLSPACTLGPILLAVARGELKDLWVWSDAPSEESKEQKLLDDTIEQASEVAQRARAELKNATTDTNIGNGEPVKDEEAEEEDDSWMEGGVVVPDPAAAAVDGSKGKKRKSGKKK